jgi:hypothetical protein
MRRDGHLAHAIDAGNASESRARRCAPIADNRRAALFGLTMTRRAKGQRIVEATQRLPYVPQPISDIHKLL